MANDSSTKEPDFENLIRAEFERISRIPLKERVLHYGRWMWHNKAVTIFGGVSLALAGGLIYEIAQSLHSTTNDIVRRILLDSESKVATLNSELS